MPYEGEFAQYKPLHRIVQSDSVQLLLSDCQLAPDEPAPSAVEHIDYIPPSPWSPTYVVAVDGSHAEVSVRNGFPGAEVSYITVASVLVDVAKRKELDQHRPVNPQEFAKTQDAESIDCALPGCNVILKGEMSAEASLRRGLYDVLGRFRMSPHGETLLDTYQALLTYKPSSSTQRCPYEVLGECHLPHSLFKAAKGSYTCPCSAARTLYSTDALRIHEGMVPAGTNGALFAEIMQVLERLWLVHVLRTMEANNWLSSLRRIAFVLDGPLAVFGHPAWLSQAIRQELYRLNELVKRATRGQDLLLIGVEKTGEFVEHLARLDSYQDGTTGRFPAGSTSLLTDGYIKSRIIFSNSTKPYGQDTYFGRKFFHRTPSGALVVASLPFLSDEHRDVTTAKPEQFPRLHDALALLSDLVSSRYPNALTPLVAAHSEAAIPLHLGNKVLEQLAKELVGQA